MSWFIPGMGMFCEAYFIFSIGNIKQIFPYEYPDCWSTHKTCTVNMTRAPDYMQIVGIIFGMCTLGYLGDKIGRKPFSHMIHCNLLTGNTITVMAEASFMLDQRILDTQGVCTELRSNPDSQATSCS